MSLDVEPDDLLGPIEELRVSLRAAAPWMMGSGPADRVLRVDVCLNGKLVSWQEIMRGSDMVSVFEILFRRAERLVKEAVLEANIPNSTLDFSGHASPPNHWRMR